MASTSQNDEHIAATLIVRAITDGIDLAGWAQVSKEDLQKNSLVSADQSGIYTSAFVIAKRHNSRAVKRLRGIPTEEYDKDYRKLNRELYDFATSTEHYLQEQGYTALAVNPSETIDKENHRGLISHRAIAERSGIGMQGRNNLIITTPFHPPVRLATVLTDVSVRESLPYSGVNPCETCDNCQRICPSGAIGETADDYSIDLCLEHLENIRAEGISYQICGACLAACPVNTTDSSC